MEVAYRNPNGVVCLRYAHSLSIAATPDVLQQQPRRGRDEERRRGAYREESFEDGGSSPASNGQSEGVGGEIERCSVSRNAYHFSMKTYGPRPMVRNGIIYIFPLECTEKSLERIGTRLS